MVVTRTSSLTPKANSIRIDTAKKIQRNGKATYFESAVFFVLFSFSFFSFDIGHITIKRAVYDQLFKIYSLATPLCLQFNELVFVSKLNGAVHRCQTFFDQVCIEKCSIFQINIAEQAILAVVFLKIVFKEDFFSFCLFGYKTDGQAIHRRIFPKANQQDQQAVG